MIKAEPRAARLAVFALLAATGPDAAGSALCAALLDGAVELLRDRTAGDIGRGRSAGIAPRSTGSARLGGADRRLRHLRRLPAWRAASMRSRQAQKLRIAAARIRRLAAQMRREPIGRADRAEASRLSS
jgi:hypothetical protein